MIDFLLLHRTVHTVCTKKCVILFPDSAKEKKSISNCVPLLASEKGTTTKGAAFLAIPSARERQDSLALVYYRRY